MPILALIVLFVMIVATFGYGVRMGMPEGALPFVIVALTGSCIMLGNLLVQAAIVRALMAHARGDRVSLRGCLAGSFGKVVPLIGLSLLMALGMIIGLVVLIVPAIIFSIIWSVAAPALVVEKLGIFAALGRSMSLSEGHRWRVFGLMALVLLFYWAFWTTMAFLFEAAGWAGGSLLSDGGGLSTAADIVGALFSLAAWTLALALWGAISASLYLELRTVREGPLTGDLAEVFA